MSVFILYVSISLYVSGKSSSHVVVVSGTEVVSGEVVAGEVVSGTVVAGEVVTNEVVSGVVVYAPPLSVE